MGAGEGGFPAGRQHVEVTYGDGHLRRSYQALHQGADQSTGPSRIWSSVSGGGSGSEWKRGFLGLEGLFFLAVGIAGFALSAGGSGNLGIFTVAHPWENVAHLLLGLLFLGVVFYPRRFRDYSIGTNVSD